MATRKEKIDIENEEQLSSAPAVEESQDPASWVPPFTVRVVSTTLPRS